MVAFCGDRQGLLPGPRQDAALWSRNTAAVGVPDEREYPSARRRPACKEGRSIVLRPGLRAQSRAGIPPPSRDLAAALGHAGRLSARVTQVIAKLIPNFTSTRSLQPFLPNRFSKALGVRSSFPDR